MATKKKIVGKEHDFLKNLKQNIENLMEENNLKSQAECMRYIKARTGFDFNQSTFSEIMSGKLFPTVMQLNAISDCFKVSIDFLLGKEYKFEELSVYEICNFLHQLVSSDLICFHEFVDTSDLYPYDENGCPNWDGTSYYSIFFKDKNRNKTSNIINNFIEKIIDIDNVKRKISKELYDKIVLEWLLEIKKTDTNELPKIVSDSIDDPLPF